jgi:hypothetical protein
VHLAHVGLGREGTGDARQYVSEKRWDEEQGQKSEDGKKREGGNSGHVCSCSHAHTRIDTWNAASAACGYNHLPTMKRHLT